MILNESVNVLGVNIILFLQSALPTWGGFFMEVSHIGDPSVALTLFFPLVAAFNQEIGISLLWTFIFCEWSNMILKWIMAGDRPYWWVHETPYYLDKNLPHIRQYPATCETGPGMPSGHSTLNAALCFILTSLLATLARKYHNFLGEKVSLWIIRSIWISYGIWIALIMISRVYIGTHFPHQCLTGVLIGMIAALWVSSKRICHIMTKQKSMILTFAIFASVGTVFGAYRALGNDPMWAMQKAMRWCIKREYIHIDSIPFYSLSRFSGHALGLGMALASSHYAKSKQARFSLKMQLSLAILTLLTGQSASFIHRVLPPSITGYYVVEFFLNTSLAYLVISTLPYFVIVSSRAKPKSKLKK